MADSQSKSKSGQPIDSSTSGAITLSTAQKNELFAETWALIPLEEQTPETSEMLSELIQQERFKEVIEIQDYCLNLQIDNSQNLSLTDNSQTFNYIDQSLTFIDNSINIVDSFKSSATSVWTESNRRYNGCLDAVLGLGVAVLTLVFLVAFIQSILVPAPAPVNSPAPITSQERP